ncbi:hypothetical protein BDW66DRAFT_154668 [Aspergillus desertorum]
MPLLANALQTSLIWGAIGPRRFFSEYYKALLYFPILGALLGLPVYALRCVYPTNTLLRKIYIPLFLVVGLIFGWAIRRKWAWWWGKYNFVLSSALDTNVSVAGLVIFFAIYFSGASSRFSWWGTEVYKDTCDYKGCAYVDFPESGNFGV